MVKFRDSRYRKRTKWEKSKAQRSHAKKQYFKRFKVWLTNREYDEIINLIKKGKGKFIYKQSNRVSIFEITYKDITSHCVYDRKRQTIATFLYTDHKQFIEEKKEEQAILFGE